VIQLIQSDTHSRVDQRMSERLKIISLSF